MVLTLSAAHAAATLFMCGLIWFVQVVHYPLFAHTGTDVFCAYERRHTRLTTWVVGPPMLVETGAAVALFALGPPGVPPWAHLAGLGLLGVLWASTAWLQVPCHTVLERGFDARVHRRLVRSNWIRTVAWTARAPLAVWMLEAVAR